MSKCIYTQEQFDKILEERNELANENFKLKQQLAEKDKGLNWLHQKFAKYVENNKDKISSAIEKLEKVKELVEEKSMTQYPFGTQKIYASDVSSIVDNQIEELKKEIVNDKEKS